MFFLTPRYVKEAKHYLHGVRKFLNYRKDILKAKDLTLIEGYIQDLQDGIRGRDREKLTNTIQAIEKSIGRIAPPPADAGWRENVEVFLVAIVVAAGVRAYFLQPFKIPTGSMQPTLYGIVGIPTDTPPPNIAVRAFQFAWLGRTYFNTTAAQDDTVTELHERSVASFFTFTDIICQNHTYSVFAPKETLERYFHIVPGTTFTAGGPVVRGYVDTGDQVFVDKISYNFVKPQRGNVFVFTTTGISRIQDTLDPSMGSEHYIKRLAGTPGTTLRIDSPKLYLDGELAKPFGFQRVMTCVDGYRGYSNPPPAYGALYLTTPDDTFTVPANSYFALGDNSYNSSDSRFWGIVPQENIAGKGLFVYWPFSSRWGLIR